MNSKLSLVVLVCFFCAFSQGLICWVCNNERSDDGCQTNGTGLLCPPDKQSCQSEVIEGSFGKLITKQCKEIQSCETDFSENIKPDWFQEKWNYRSPRSVCRCCCGTHLCNKDNDCKYLPENRDEMMKFLPVPGCEAPMNIENGEYYCNTELAEDGSFPANTECIFICDQGFNLEGVESTTCTVIDKFKQQASFQPLEIPTCTPGSCQKLSDVKNGQIECDNENEIGSVCSYSCNSGYTLYPGVTNTSACQTDQTWEDPDQCCLRDCSSNVKMDLIIVLDSSYSIGRANWKRMLDFVGNITDNYNLGPEAARIGVLTYSSGVDKKRQIYLNRHQTDLIKTVQKLKWLHQGTATGLALKHVRTNMLNGRRGDRKNAQNVVLVITDGSSNDTALVMKESRLLRNAGAVTYAVGVRPENGKGLNIQELSSIAGTDENMKIVENGFAGLDEKFAKSLGSILCGTRSCGASIKRPPKIPIVPTMITPPPPQTAILGISQDRIVERDEVFTTPAPLCEPPNELLNGKINCAGEPDEKGMFRPGTDCVFVCDAGHDLEGGSETKCVSKVIGAQFEDVSPFCRPRSCKTIGTIVNGTVTCDRGHEVNSICQFGCNEGYHLFKHHVTSAQCEINQQWSNGNPCCLRDCNKNMAMDFIIVLDSSYSVGANNWKLMLNFTTKIIENYQIQEDKVRIGVLSFSSFRAAVTSKHRIYLNEYMNNKTELIKQVQKLIWIHEGTATGIALNYVRTNMFLRSKGSRKNVQKVVLVITDGSSNNTAKVNSESWKLRQNGVITYAIGVQPPSSQNLNYPELRLIGGSEDHVEIAEKGFADLDETYAEKLTLDLCKKRSCA